MAKIFQICLVGMTHESDTFTQEQMNKGPFGAHTAKLSDVKTEIDWAWAVPVHVEDDNGNEIDVPGRDSDLVKHLKIFAPAYNYLQEEFPETLQKNVLDDMDDDELAQYCKDDRGMFCEESGYYAAEKLAKEGAFVIFDPQTEQKAGNMYANEAKELLASIVKTEGWDAVWRLIEHKYFITSPQPSLFERPATIL